MGTKNQRANRKERRKFHNQEQRRQRKMNESMMNESGVSVPVGETGPEMVDHIPAVEGLPAEQQPGVQHGSVSMTMTSPPVEQETEEQIHTKPTSAHDAGEKWDASDIAVLKDLVRQGLSNKEVALRMGRTSGAIQSKKYALKKKGELVY